MYRKPLILDSPPPDVAQKGCPLDIAEFFSESMLQQVQFVVLKMDLNEGPRGARCWLRTVEMLLDIWAVKNSLKVVNVLAQHDRRLIVGSAAEYSRHMAARRILAKAGPLDLHLASIWLIPCSCEGLECRFLCILMAWGKRPRETEERRFSRRRARYDVTD